MIRIVLFDNQHNYQGSVEFGNLPVTDHDDYRCTPDGLLAHETAAAIAHELHQGAVTGWVERYHWYRQANEAGKNGKRDEGLGIGG